MIKPCYSTSQPSRVLSLCPVNFALLCFLASAHMTFFVSLESLLCPQGWVRVSGLFSHSLNFASLYQSP